MCNPRDRETSPAVIDALFAGQAARALALRKSSAAERSARLARLLDALMARREAFAAAFAKDLGKPAVEVDLTELLPVIDDIRHAQKHLKRWMRPQRVAPTLVTLGTKARIVYQPRGRCLIIGPWNYPVSTLVGPLVSAVAAGNTAILKPSEFTPNVNAVIGEIVAEVFEPAEVAMVEGAIETSTHLLALPFEHVFFTGSPAVGKVVMAAAAKHLASVTLELGGKSPVVVDASADLRHAAEHVMWGKLVNAGQTCVAPDHLYVHRSVMDRFVALCREVLAERFGADAAAVAASESLGRMVHSRHAQRVVALVDDAVAQGARVLAGGAHDAQRRYVAPTLLAEVPDAARIAQEEIFGPVLPIAPFDSLDEVIARINAAPKPLALYLWSRDAGAVEQLRSETSSGSFCVNLCLQQYAHQNLPFGGVNNSGIGNAHGFFGFKAFSHERAVLAGGPFSALKLLFPPYTPGKVKLSQRMVAAIRRL
ncbi:MAG TPA: aldehyde dehydrogenase family protein [Piscinibacter sp.]|jgi:aldehyde dehydrogenase (NAD+)|uniref:aldehyde dehydrogenase family protein n=1 Tax=Piscinibacter sp. TaxID=1903157 RepID=UPI002BC40B91|nr:aldehyde dehydrogenase family protein [Piscinibacter sp.]HNK19100.1 aldehyde dehydrogenase family protein [Piscinibacter sp.]